MGTAGNDTFTGASGTYATGDTIVDNSSTDQDTIAFSGAEFGATIDTTGMTIRGVENVTATFDSFANSTFTGAGLSGVSKVTVNQAREASSASITVDNVAAGSTVVAGTNVNTLIVQGMAADENLIIDGASAKTAVTGSVSGTGTLSITANTAKTITSTAATATINAKAATTINLNSVGTTDVATVSSEGATTLANTNVETLNLNGTAAVTYTITGGLGATSTNLGSADVTIAADDALVTGKTVTGAAGTVQVGDGAGAGTIGADFDLTKVASTLDVVVDDAMGGAAKMTVNNGETVKIARDLTNALSVAVNDGATTNSTTNSVSLTLAADINNDNTSSIVVDNTATDDDIATLNVAVTAAQTDLLLTTTAADVTVNLSGDKDVVLNNTSTFKTLNASTLTGALTATADTSSLSITSGSGDDNLTATAAAAVIVAGSGSDTVNVGAVTYTKSIDGGEGSDTLKLTGAAVLTSATLSGFEIINTNTNTVSLNDNQLNGSTYVVLGTTAATNDDLLVVQDIDTATFDLSKISGSDVDAVYYNATGANYTTVAVQTGATVTAALDATALGSAVAMNVTGSMFSDVIVTGGGADTISGGKGNDEIASGAGNDTVNGGEGDDTLIGGAGDDVLIGGEGLDTITGGAGNDTINLTETTAQKDTVVFDAIATNGQDTIIGFAAGAGADVATLGDTTTAGTTSANAVFATSSNTTLTNGAAAFALTGGNTATDDVIEITATLSSNGDLAKAGVTDGTELLKALSSTTTAATGLTATNDDDDFYIVVYQGGNAYLYFAKETNDVDTGLVEASEITLVGTFTGIAAGAFASGDFNFA